MWISQPVSSLIYNIPSLIAVWPHPESWPRGFLSWGLAQSTLVSVMRKFISECGKAQKFYTASGGPSVQGSEMAHVPASIFRTFSDCHQDLRITEGSSRKAIQCMLPLISNIHSCCVFLETVKMSPMPLCPPTWAWKTTWAEKEHATTEPGDTPVHVPWTSLSGHQSNDHSALDVSHLDCFLMVLDGENAQTTNTKVPK